MILLLTAVLLLTPVPLSNVAPAMVISLISLAYVEEDGLLLSVALLGAIILVGISAAAVCDGSRSEQRIASHHVGRHRRGLGCQVHDKNASTPCISPHGERLRYPLSSGTPLRSRFSAGSRSDFQKSWAETSLESFMPGMQSHANQGVGCMSDRRRPEADNRQAACYGTARSLLC